MGDPVDIIANVATGGVYGLAKAGVDVASGNSKKALGDLPLGLGPVSAASVGAVTGIGKVTKAPAIPGAATTPLPNAPTIDNTHAQLQAAAQTEQQTQRRRASTILTSPRGVLDQAPVAVKNLLGQ